MYVSAGEAQTIGILAEATLKGIAIDDGVSGTLRLSWQQVGGAGEVSFAGASALETTAIFSQTGSYRLRLTADDGEFQVSADTTVTVLPAIRQANYLRTGADRGATRDSDSWLTVPSIDPSSVVYHPPSDTLFLVDSEINEVEEAFAYAQGNLFQLTLAGDALLGTWDLTISTNGEPKNYEPTGIAYCPSDDHFYVTNDDRRMIYRYRFDGERFIAVDWLAREVDDYAPKGITCHPATGRLFVVSDQNIEIVVYRHQETFVEERVLALLDTTARPDHVPTRPAGVAFDSVSTHLFVVSSKDEAVFVYTTDGAFVQKLDLRGFSPRLTAPNGLALGPASAQLGATSLYLTDRGVDNNQDENERDGALYEAILIHRR